MWARADSETAHGVSVSSMVQFLKLLRNPWTVANSASPVARSTFVNVMSDMGAPGLRGEGNTRARLVTYGGCLPEHINGL